MVEMNHPPLVGRLQLQLGFLLVHLRVHPDFRWLCRFPDTTWRCIVAGFSLSVLSSRLALIRVAPSEGGSTSPSNLLHLQRSRLVMPLLVPSSHLPQAI